MDSLTSFQKTILDFYATCGRQLPWRKTRDPYKILVSEIMLQQTQVDRVIPKYQGFIREFPDFKSLARASLATVITQWQGLGYNRRAIALKKIAELVIKKYQGKLPRSEAELKKLPGIGNYTAAAICVFAYQQPLVMIETNIRTVFIHYFFQHQTTVSDHAIAKLVKKTLDSAAPRQWYYALMDYGAMLKKKYPNPSRKSVHYTKQSSFRGSNREIRGLILKILTQQSSLSEKKLLLKIAKQPMVVKKNLQDLMREGFIEKRDNKISFKTS